MGEFNSLDDVKDAVTEHTLGAAATFGWGGSIGTEPGGSSTPSTKYSGWHARRHASASPCCLTSTPSTGTRTWPDRLSSRTDWEPARPGTPTSPSEPRISVRPRSVRRAPTRTTRPRATSAGNPAGVASSRRSARARTLGRREMAAAKVRGYQGDGIGGDENVVATAKHFPAYSNPERGEDAAPAEISEYRLWNTFLRPFESVIDEGVTSVMPSYTTRRTASRSHGSNDSSPTSCGGRTRLRRPHRLGLERRPAPPRGPPRHRGLARIGLSLTGGRADRRLCRDDGHVKPPRRLVAAGDLDESTLDEKVRRVLALKFPPRPVRGPFRRQGRGEWASSATRTTAKLPVRRRGTR